MPAGLACSVFAIQQGKHLRDDGFRKQLSAVADRNADMILQTWDAGFGKRHAAVILGIETMHETAQPFRVGTSDRGMPGVPAGSRRAAFPLSRSAAGRPHR